MSEMYVWKVKLELQWKSEWEENGKKKSEYLEDVDEELTVAAPSGRDAIAKAEKVALTKESFTGEHYLEDDKTVPSKETPYKILDIVSLELLQTLDG